MKALSFFAAEMARVCHKQVNDTLAALVITGLLALVELWVVMR